MKTDTKNISVTSSESLIDNTYTLNSVSNRHTVLQWAVTSSV